MNGIMGGSYGSICDQRDTNKLLQKIRPYYDSSATGVRSAEALQHRGRLVLLPGGGQLTYHGRFQCDELGVSSGTGV